MNRRRFISAAMLVTLAGAPGVRADRRQVMEQQKRQALEALAKKPLLDKTRVEEVFAISREGPDLVVHTFITPTKFYEERRAELDGLPFPAVVQCRELSRDMPQVDFQFDVDDWSDPLVQTMLHLQWQSQGQTIDMQRIVRAADGERNVRFTQNVTRGNQPVELVYFNGDTPARGSVTHVPAESFAELRRQHPLEVEAYLRPMLRQMRQEGALAPETDEAWQVLIDEWPVDDHQKEAVEKHLAALDDNDFRVRSAAADALYRLGRDAAIYMIHLDRKRLTPEQGLRLDQVIARYKPLPEARAARLRDDLHFLTDCLDCPDSTVRRLALARLRRLTGREIRLDLDAKQDARAAAANEVRDQLFRSDGTTRPNRADEPSTQDK